MQARFTWQARQLSLSALHKAAASDAQAGFWVFSAPCNSSALTCCLTAGLLSLPEELVQEQLAARLSCRALGSLMLSCRQLRASMASAELTGRLAEASRTLSKAHPLWSAPCAAEHLDQQARVRAAIAARDSWTRTELHAGKLSNVSPDLTRAASVEGVLRLRDLTAHHATPAEILLAVGSWSYCMWSPDGDLLAWEGQHSYGPGLRYQSPIYLYRLSTRRLHSLVLERGKNLAGLPETQFLPCGGLLQAVGVRGSTECYLAVVSLGADGQLSSKTCGVSYHDTYWRSFSGMECSTRCLSVSPQGRIAFPSQGQGLCLWQPSGRLRTSLRKLDLAVLNLTWDPVGSMVLVDQEGYVCFVDVQGGVVAVQELLIRGPVYWGHQGVIAGGASPELREICFFAVHSGPHLELQHRFLLSDNTWPHSQLALSADHFAFIVAGQAPDPLNLELSPRQLCVFQTPLARFAGSEVQVTHVPPLPAATELGSARRDCNIEWRQGGILFQLDRSQGGLMETEWHTVLVKFC